MVIGQTEGKSWEVIGVASCKGTKMPMLTQIQGMQAERKLMDATRLSYDPVHLVRNGLRSLYDTAIMIYLIERGTLGGTIPDMTEYLRSVHDQTVRTSVLRLIDLGFICRLGREGKKPAAMVFSATKKGLTVMRGESLG